MPRKTPADLRMETGDGGASMRPRPDAAENAGSMACLLARPPVLQ